MNVLIVDDEPINVLLLESLLMGKYTTRTAENGHIACKKIEEQVPDIVLLDVLMPVMDGFSTLKTIKENKQLDNVIVIMVTAKVEKEDVQKAMLIGADDYIKKPIDATELYTKIDIHSRLRKSAEQILEYQVYANIHDSMIAAQRIQQSLLPDKNHFNNIFPNSFTLYKPRDMIGGDLYFVSQRLHKRFLCVSDSIGHGVPAAMLSMLAYMGLNYIVNRMKIINPVEVAKLLLKELSNTLSSSSDTYVDSYDLDAIFCEFDLDNNILTYSSIGRPLVIVRNEANSIVFNGEELPPLMSDDSSHLFYVRGDLSVLEQGDKEEKFRNNEVKLMDGDMIYIYSDGITDQFGGPKDKKFSKKRFLELLLECQNSPLKLQKLKIYQEIEQWGMTLEQTDDIVLVGIKI